MMEIFDGMVAFMQDGYSLKSVLIDFVIAALYLAFLEYHFTGAPSDSKLLEYILRMSYLAKLFVIIPYDFLKFIVLYFHSGSLIYLVFTAGTVLIMAYAVRIYSFVFQKDEERPQETA